MGLWLVAASGWAAEECRTDIAWDYTPNPVVVAFRLYLCPQSGGYSFGTLHRNCGYQAVEPSPEGRDTTMSCHKLHVASGIYYAVVTAVWQDGQESGPSNEKEVMVVSSGAPPPSTPPPSTQPPPSDVPTGPPPLAPLPSLPPVGTGDSSNPPSPSPSGGNGGISSTCQWQGKGPC